MIYLLTGPICTGKTTLLKKTIKELTGTDLRVNGYLSEAVWKDRQFLGYDLFDLKENQAYPFIRKQGKESWEHIGPFFFMPETLERAKNIILRAESEDITFVDEVGPLELEGGGVWPAIEKVCFIPSLDFFLVVRSSILKRFLDRIKSQQTQVFDIKHPSIHTKMVQSIRLITKKRDDPE